MKMSKEQARRILKKNKSKFLKKFMTEEKSKKLLEAFQDKTDAEIPDFIKEMLSETKK